MVIDRRNILVGATALAVTTQISLPMTGHAAGGVRFASAARAPNGQYHVAMLGEDGALERLIPIAQRGHDVAISPNASTAVMFARRPGTFGVAIDLVADRPPQIFTTVAERHFYGHGVFSPDGRLLYATENDYQEARGVLGVYDVGAGFKRIGELETHGVGPHEVLLMPDGKTLCVANGGIETHPDAGRAKLNLDTMTPSIVFIDRLSGELKSQHALSKDLHLLSLRHLCCDGLGRVWLGGQWEGGNDTTPWLIGRVGLDEPIDMQVPLAPAEHALSGLTLKGYIGSMSASADGQIIAASAPRAGRVIYVESQTGRLIGQSRHVDACGIAPAGEGTIAFTTGEGHFEVVEPDGAMRNSRKVALSFDNHLRRIAVA